MRADCSIAEARCPATGQQGVALAMGQRRVARVGPGSLLGAHGFPDGAWFAGHEDTLQV